MTTEYGTFRCRICGREGFAPLPSAEDACGETERIELTCAHAHTDQYDIAVIQRITNRSPGKMLSRKAYAGAI